MYSGGVIALNGSGNVLWNYPTQAGMKALAVADVNGDGKNEIVASSDETLGAKQGIYLMNGSGSLIWYKQFANDTNSIAIGDIDGDGVNDIVAGTDGGDIFVINGVGSVLWSSSFSNTPISDVAIGDFDGDGRKNEVAACGAYYSLNSGRHDGTWVFDNAGHMIWEFGEKTNFVSLAGGDINADGIDDVVVSTVDLEHSSGGETYALSARTSVGNPYDINGDGVVDMKDIGIAARAFGTSPDDPRWNLLADVNGDGKIDLRDIALIAQHF
jgi:hypothetical protein